VLVRGSGDDGWDESGPGRLYAAPLHPVPGTEGSLGWLTSYAGTLLLLSAPPGPPAPPGDGHASVARVLVQASARDGLRGGGALQPVGVLPDDLALAGVRAVAAGPGTDPRDHPSAPGVVVESDRLMLAVVARRGGAASAFAPVTLTVFHSAWQPGIDTDNADNNSSGAFSAFAEVGSVPVPEDTCTAAVRGRWAVFAAGSPQQGYILRAVDLRDYAAGYVSARSSYHGAGAHALCMICSCRYWTSTAMATSGTITGLGAHNLT
jgi:hypothetical protein